MNLWVPTSALATASSLHAVVPQEPRRCEYLINLLNLLRELKTFVNFYNLSVIERNHRDDRLRDAHRERLASAFRRERSTTVRRQTNLVRALVSACTSLGKALTQTP